MWWCRTMFWSSQHWPEILTWNISWICEAQLNSSLMTYEYSVRRKLCSDHCIYTRGRTFRLRQGWKQGFFTKKYFRYLVHMKALHLLFHMRYGSPLCSRKWLCGSPECWVHLHEAGTTPKYALKIYICYRILKIFGSADSPASPLLDEVW